MERHAITWTHGMASVQSLGGMLGPVLFLLPDGRQVSPLHVAPWFNEASRHDHPAILQELRGEWPCVPFGADGPRNLPAGWSATGASFDGAHVPHGHSSNSHWRFATISPTRLDLVCDYPDAHPIRRLTRSVSADPDAPALDITLTVEARRPCALPMGLHPSFRLPSGTMAHLEPARFRQGRVFPIDVEAGRGILQPDATFTSLAAIPRRGGGTLSLTDLPLALKTEELLQLLDIEGGFVLRHRSEGWQVRLTWNAADFPSLLLWVSNRGRDYAPWDGRHIALGAEPIRSAFDLGPAVSAAPNPISASGTPTTQSFDPATPFVTRYRIAVEPLSDAT